MNEREVIQLRKEKKITCEQKLKLLQMIFAKEISEINKEINKLKKEIYELEKKKDKKNKKLQKVNKTINDSTIGFKTKIYINDEEMDVWVKLNPETGKFKISNEGDESNVIS